MAKWEDTVMSNEQIMEEVGLISINYRRIAKKQAQISFEAGMKAERAFILQNTDRDERARKEGHREVVEWLRDNCHDEYGSLSGWSVFQIKLKEWGLE